MTKASKKSNARMPKDPRSPAPKDVDATDPPTPVRKKTAKGAKDAEKTARSNQRANMRPVCEKCGEVHKGCNAHTKHGPNAGKPCGYGVQPMMTVCPKHGAKAPQIKKKARERLMELVDPALAAMSKVLHDPETEDAVKVRAATAILDRTGFRPGMVVEVTADSRWEQLLGDLAADRDMTSLGGTSERDAIEARAHNEQAIGQVQREEAWNKLDDEDARADERSRARYSPETVVQGEVVREPPTPNGGGEFDAREYEDRLRDRLDGQGGR